MKRDNAIQKSFRREINLQTQIVKNKKFYTRKMKHKKITANDRVFIIENCAIGNSFFRNSLWGTNAA